MKPFNVDDVLICAGSSYRRWNLEQQLKRSQEEEKLVRRSLQCSVWRFIRVSCEDGCAC